MTDQEHSVDVIGAYPAFDAVDAASDEDQELEEMVIAIWDDLCDRHKETGHGFIKLQLERRRKSLGWWPPYSCAALSRASKTKK